MTDQHLVAMEEETAVEETINLEKDEANDEGEPSLVEDENIAPEEPDGSTSRPEEPKNEEQTSNNCAAEDHPAPPAAADAVTDAVKASTQSEEQASAHVISLVDQGTFGVTAEVLPKAVSASAARATTSSITAENSDDVETDNEESDTTQQRQQAFVNHGFAAWEESRHHWLNHNKEGRDVAAIRRANNHHAVPINVDEIIDVVFASPRQLRANGGIGRNFPQPVALPQMVDILQDLWEAEGLDV